MKKARLSAVVLSLILTIAALVPEVCALAGEQWQPRPNAQGPLGYVNSELSEDIYVVADPETGGTKISYEGEGSVDEWEFPLLTEGKDYEIIKEEENVIVLNLLREDKALPYINAVINEGGEAEAQSETAGAVESTAASSQAAGEPQSEASLHTEPETQDAGSEPRLNKSVIACLAAAGGALLCFVAVAVKKRSK